MIEDGRVAERFNVPDSKSGVGETLPWVQIPPRPSYLGNDRRYETNCGCGYKVTADTKNDPSISRLQANQAWCKTFVMHDRISLGLLLLWAAISWQPHSKAAESIPTAVATFECLSLYWAAPQAQECLVQYRPSGKDHWENALPLVYDTRDQEWRGSIIGLVADTEYEIMLQAGVPVASFKTRTRSDKFSVGATTTLPPGNSRECATIRKSGSEQGYHLVTPPEDEFSTIDVLNRTNCLVIDADYVIVRGVEMRNAATHAVLIKSGHHDIVVEECHISGWGRFTGPASYGNTGGDQDSAIYAEAGCGNLTLQRNLIENPRGSASDWDDGHPVGPQAISLVNSTGRNIIRYNDIRSTEYHGFNDGIGGEDNYSRAGSPCRDSDIYGNKIQNCWDDAIESEGANMNVRIWGNYLDLYYNGVATACVSRGPIYVFRNIFAKSRYTYRNPIGGSCIKTGESDEFGGGRRYIFHNTALQPNGPASAFSTHVAPNTITRNNIFDCYDSLATTRDKLPSSDYDYDFFSGEHRGIAKESHGVRGKVGYLETGPLEFYPAPRVSAVSHGSISLDLGDGKKKTITDPVTLNPSPVIDAGAVLANFNDDFVGKGPDIGAFEVGRPPLEFGRSAYVKGGKTWAPWEIR